MPLNEFLYFGFPSDISGDVWTYYGEDKELVSGYSGATPLALGATTVDGTNTEEVISLIDQYSFLNVFKYLTFRTGLSVVTSLIVVFIIGGPLIKLFSEKMITGPIRPVSYTHLTLPTKA